jgi:outer membrane protein OmpA-like peptidoglycan-associated protein/curli biogenesis system outer membrane secretion channel CsgG
LVVLIVSSFLAMPALPARNGADQAKSKSPSYTIGIFPFQDMSGSEHGESLARVLAKQFQAAILNASRHTPRFLKAGEGQEEAEQIDLESAIDLARSEKVDFAIIGLLISAEVSESEGGIRAPSTSGVSAGAQKRTQAAEVVLQVELIDVERGERVASLRSKGKDKDSNVSASLDSDYGSMDMGSSSFQNTVLGKAMQKAIKEVVKDMLPKMKTSTAAAASGAGKAPAPAQPATEEAVRPAAAVAAYEQAAGVSEKATTTAQPISEEAVRPTETAAAPEPTARPSGQATDASAQAAAEVFGNRYDFVPGSKTLVYDDFSETDVGEYPAKWTTKEGGGNTAEVVQLEGRKFFQSRYSAEGADSSMHWLRYEIKGDLPKNFTIELDADVQGYFTIVFSDQSSYGGQEISFEPERVKSLNADNPVNLGSGVKHVSMNASGTSVKAYVGGERVLNDPDAIVRPITRIGFRFDSTGGEPNKGQMFTAFRLAEGGKDFKSMLAGVGRIVAHGILFDTGSNVLKPESGPELRNILQLLQEDPNLRLAIEGHTDSQGGPSINGPLSERRAEAVKAWLVGQGIDASRLTTKGFGDTKPMDTNSTAEGRANNRRVEFARI